jgi:hypothetical protein
MADRYWVGGSGTWDTTTTTNWSTSSGGSGGASATTSADNVIFDANSNTGTNPFTVTVSGSISTPALCNDFTASSLDGAMTLDFPVASTRLDCYGSMTLPATNFSWTTTGSGSSVTFRATTSGKTITTNGVSIPTLSFIFDGVGGVWTLGSALSSSVSTRSINVINGTFNSGNYNITWGSLSVTDAGTQTINLGSSTYTVAASGTTPINFTETAGLTFNAGTSTITSSVASPTFNGGGQTFYNVSFTSAANGQTTINGANTFNNLSQTSRSATGRRIFQISANQTVSGTLTLGAANTAIRRIHVTSEVVGTQRTITLNGTLATLSDVDFQDINAAGTAGTWTGTRLGNGLNNSGITFDAPKTVYWNLAGSQSWSSTGWATTNTGTPAVNNFPLAQDTAVFTEAGAAGTINIDGPWFIGEITMADGVSNRTSAMTLTFNSTLQIFIFKNITLFSNLTISGTVGTLVFSGQGTTQTITSAGVTFTNPIAITSPSGTVQLLDNLTSSNNLTLTLGTLDLNDFDLTCNIFSSTNANTRAIDFGSGEINLTGNAATILSMGTLTGFTYAGTPTINATYSGSTGTRTLNAGVTGVTESTAMNLNITAGTDIVTLANNQSIKNLNFTGFSGTLTNQARFIYGNLTISSGMSLDAGASATIFSATSGTQQITTNGKTLDFPITINGVGTTVELQDALTIGSTRTLTLTNGTFTTNNYNVTTGLFSSSNSNTRTLTMGSGTWTISGTGTAWNLATTTNLTFNRDTSTISMTNGTSQTFAGGGLTYYKLNQGGLALTITGANTFYDISNTVQPTTIIFPASTTTTFNNFSLNGTSGNLVALESSSAGVQATLLYTP